MPVFSPIYSIPYLLVFVLLFFMWRLEISKRCKNQPTSGIRITVFMLLLLFIGLRGFIYSDWTAYYSTFESIPTVEFVNWDYFLPSTEKSDSDWESGFLLYSILLKSMGLDYWGWNFLSTFIDLCIISYLFKRNLKYYALAFIVFFIYEGFGMEVNLMRNAKSIVLFLISIRFLENRRFFPYLLLNLLGFCFHSSSLVYIFLYFVLSHRIPRKIFWIVFIIGNIIFLFHIQFIIPLLMKLVELLGGRAANQLLAYTDMGLSYGITIGYLERCFMFVLFMQNYKKLMKDRNMYIYLNMYLVYFFFFFFFAELSVIGSRLSVLFIPSYWFLLPVLYSYLTTKKKRMYFCTLLFLYGTMKIVSANNNIYSRYDNLLFGIESYESRKYIFNRYYDKILDN